MGRIKGFLCSFCLDTRMDSVNGETTFDRNIDVSHLANPHVTSSPTVKADRCKPSAQAFGDLPEIRPSNTVESQDVSRNNNCSTGPVQQHRDFELSQSNLHQQNHLNEESSPHIRPGSNLAREAESSRQPSPPCSQPSQSNFLVNLQNDHPEQAEAERDLHQVQEQSSPRILPQAQPPLVAARNSLPSTSITAPAKLSYDIISVREPLAKILAERQLLVGQQQQRQVLGDHEYIEVYGERGSSCFYEEIAGSVTSSATYDQIGNNSNHNYQVLINAYAVANRQSVANHINHESNYIAQNLDSSSNSNDDPETSVNHKHENSYDVTVHRLDGVDGPSIDTSPSNPPLTRLVSSNIPGPSSSSLIHQHPVDSGTTNLTQSIPVYSVINKATRRRSSIVRAAFNDSRPPKPPPKNSFISNHISNTSAISHEDASSTSQDETNVHKPRNTTPQNPSTSSFIEDQQAKNLGTDPANHRNNRLPQPPPRPSKNSAFNHTADRPLPSPNGNMDKLNNNSQNTRHSDDDIESINNGYELLRANFEDDQIDVGYEKIRESNRYSGGSISSQFYSRQLIDNGGYESVQPIYSSPSNCYEALNPATASEIAAAAAAKLNILEKFSNNDR